MDPERDLDRIAWQQHYELLARREQAAEYAAVVALRRLEAAAEVQQGTIPAADYTTVPEYSI